jgi:hypothetical protein
MNLIYCAGVSGGDNNLYLMPMNNQHEDGRPLMLVMVSVE